MRLGWIAVAIVATLAPGTARAAGDYPLASCKGWNGTLVDITGIDTKAARMEGIVTKIDLREYCNRDPGGVTVQYGGDRTIEQCVEKYWRDERATKLSSTADCRRGTLSMESGGQVLKARFPMDENANTSCASGMPPLIEQFKMMCPRTAARMGVE